MLEATLRGSGAAMAVCTILELAGIGLAYFRGLACVPFHLKIHEKVRFKAQSLLMDGRHAVMGSAPGELQTLCAYLAISIMPSSLSRS